MEKLEQYLEKNEVNIKDVISIDISGKLAIATLKEALKDYFSRCWYSVFNFYFTDKDGEYSRISINSEGYEMPIFMDYNNVVMYRVEDQDDAFRKIEKLMLE